MNFQNIILTLKQIKESDDFHNWADAQPMEIKKWIYENNSDGTLAARAIDLYKKDRGLGIDKKTTKKASKNEGADLLVKTNEQVQNSESKDVVFNRSDIAKMTDEEFMQYEKDIVKAQREGRVKIINFFIFYSTTKNKGVIMAKFAGGSTYNFGLGGKWSN